MRRSAPIADEPSTNGAAASVPAPEPAPSSFDVARASAFGTEMAAVAAAAAESAESEPEPEEDAAPVPAFRIAEDPDVVRVRPGGPVVELEASLARGIEPVDAPPAEDAEPEDPTVAAKPERSPEDQAWRRTAMAALSSLAGDSDDLTPHRRR